MPAGQFGRVIGYIEALPEEADSVTKFEFLNKMVGNNIPPEFHSAIEKGFREAAFSGPLIGAPVEVCTCQAVKSQLSSHHQLLSPCRMNTIGNPYLLTCLSFLSESLFRSSGPLTIFGTSCEQGVRAVLTDGAAHAVDSNEMAFRVAAINGFRQAYMEARPIVLEPIMNVEVTVPSEFQGEEELNSCHPAPHLPPCLISHLFPLLSLLMSASVIIGTATSTATSFC